MEIAARIAMTTMTIRSSTMVKAGEVLECLCSLRDVCRVRNVFSLLT